MGIFLRGKENGKKVYHVIYRDVNGKRIAKSLKTSDKKLAKDLAREIEVKAKRGLLQDPQKKDKDTFLTEYEKTVTNRKAHTNTNESYAINRFLGSIDAKTINAVKPDDVRAYMTGFKKKAPQTFNNTLGVIKRFFKFAVDSGYLLKNPADGIKRLPMPRNPPKFYTDQEFNRIEKVLEGQTGKPAHPLYPMVVTARYTGLRLGELIHLEWQDFEWDKKQVKVLNKEQYGHTVKNHKARVVPVMDELRDKLLPFIRKEGLCFPVPSTGEKYNHQGPRRVLRQILRKAEIPKRKREGWHDFRHTFGSLLGQKGVSMLKIKEWMGHSSLAVTEIYVRLQPGYDPDIEKLSLSEPVQESVKEPMKEAAEV